MKHSSLITLLAALFLALSLAFIPLTSGFAEGEPEVTELSPRAEAFRDRLIGNAQTIYNREMSGFSSAANCMNVKVNHRKQGYVETLMNADQYNKLRNFVFDMTELGVNVGIACLSGDAKKVLKEVLSESADILLEQAEEQLTQQLDIHLPPTETTELIYTLADQAASSIHYSDLLNIMEQVESNGGIFESADQAYRFIKLYQENKGAFLALEMGVNYYQDQMSTPWWEHLAELAEDIVISNILDIIGGDLQETVEEAGAIVEYAFPAALQSVVDGYELAAAQVANERLRTYYAGLASLTLETYQLLYPDISDIPETPRHTVYFDAGEGDCSCTEMYVYEHYPYRYLPAAYRFGYRLLGWYTDPEGGEIVYRTDVFGLTMDQHLYAHWERIVLSEGDCGPNLHYIHYGDGELDITGSGEMTSAPWDHIRVAKVNLPEGLTRICDSAFSRSWYLFEIELPSTVTVIEDEAFAKSRLCALELPAGIQTLGVGLLDGNSRVKSIVFPAGLQQIRGREGSLPGYGPLKNSAVESVAFAEGTTTLLSNICKDAESLTQVTIPDTVTTIQSRAFYGCESLQNIDLPDSVTSIGMEAFGETDLQGITLPSGLISLGTNVFSGCRGILELTIPKTVTTAREALEDSFVETVIFESGMTVVPELVCCQSVTVTEVSIPESVIEIGDMAFDGCTSLEQIQLPERLRKIGMYAFADSGLQQLLLPEGLETAEEYILDGNTGVTSIVIPAGLQWTFGANNSGVLGRSNVKNVVFAPGTTRVSRYICMEDTALETVVFPAGVQEIGSFAFKGCIALRAVELPASVISIGASAFEDTSSLGAITLPAGLKTLGSYFLSGSGVKELTIPAGIETFGSAVLSGSNVESVVFAPGTARVADHICYEARSLRQAVLPEGLTEIGLEAFSTCPALTSLEIPDSVTFIDDYAFRLTGLQNLTLPENLQRLGMNLLEGNTALKEITIPASVTVYGGTYAAAFPERRGVLGGSAVEKVTFALGTLTVGPVCAFDNALQQVILPEGVTEIAEYAFYQCAGLTDITLPSSLKKIGGSAFVGTGLAPQLYLTENTLLFEGAGESTALRAYLLPDSVCVPEEQWISSQGDVAWMEDGQCRAAAPGGTILTVTANGLSAAVPVIVKAPQCAVLPDNLTVIEDEAFAGAAIQMLQLPNQVSSIGAYAFGPSLAVIVMPDSVTEIADTAFASSERIGFLCNSDNEAAEYARQHGIPCVISK